MIKTIHIKNFALIDDVTIDIRQGFSVITGETGAGKSILLDALGLLLGKRADISALKDSDKKCVVEATFDIQRYKLQALFEQEDLEYEDETIIRREISKSGKSRAFINDSPVVLSSLKIIGDKLVDIHGQHALSILRTKWFYFDLIDGYASLFSQRDKYADLYRSWTQKKEEIAQLKSKKASDSQELEFKKFQHNEIASLQLQEGEQDELEKELELLSNADGLREKMSFSSELLKYKDASILELMSNVEDAISAIADVHSSLPEIKERLSSVRIELDDIHEELESISSKISADPSRLEYVDQRLATIFSLVKRFAVLDSDQLIEKQKELANEISFVEEGEGKIEELERELQEETKSLRKLADDLSKARKKLIPKLEQLVLGDLKKLKIEGAQLNIDITSTEFNVFGSDSIDLMFSANKGNKLSPIAKVASGGELSRVMLSLKKVLCEQKALPTIIFDEIDTGVSGEVADHMAEMMSEMATEMQVLSISHLPQIAAKSSTHYKVEKSSDGNSTSSKIKILSDAERVQELAAMLSGSKITDAAISNAKELLGV